MADKLKVLFLCTGNSCRSQMAEGWARQLKGDVIAAYSAGTEPRGLDPRALHAAARLKRAGRVVDAGMDDAAVVPGLVGRDARLLVQHHDSRARVPLGQRDGGGEPDDAGADDGDVSGSRHAR